MRAILIPLACVLLILTACSDDDASAEQHDGPPSQATVPEGDPRDLPKVPADEASIRAMLRDRFGEAVARNLRIAVEDSGGAGGVRVTAHGEAPTEEVRVAVMDELSARVEGLKFEDFDITVAGPIGMLWRFDANIDGKSRFAVFSPDLSLTATTQGEIYETATGRRINRLAIAELRDVTALAFSPDGKLLATGHWDGQIMLWDMPLGASQKELSPPGPAMRWVLTLQFTADGKSLASLSQDRGEIHLWDLAAGNAKLIGAHAAKDSPTPMTRGVMAVAPDGKTIASACDYDDGVTLWDVAKRSRRDVLKGELFTPEGLAWSKDSRHLAVARFNQPESGTVIVWDLTNKQPRTFTPDRSTTVEAVGFSDDGKTLAVRYENEGIRFWDFPAGQKWLDLPRDKSGGGSSLRFSPGGNVLAIEADALDPAGIRLWNVSARPGASRETPKLPPALGDAVTPRDDRLAQEIELAIRGTFDPRNIETLSVEVQPDGGVRLTGKVSGPSVKDHAGRIAATKGAGVEIIHEPRQVVNELEITGRYGELKSPR